MLLSNNRLPAKVNNMKVNNKIVFCVFSFNRGKFLRNCIQSIEKNVPFARILIFDDDSSDSETINILNNLKQKHTVYQPGYISNHHLGGLYGNMQSALEACKNEKLVCYLQDDTQIVRPLLDTDIEHIEHLFLKLPDLGFINPCFIRGINRTRKIRYQYDPVNNVYFRDPDKRSAGRYFSALLITKPDRLIQSNWTFLSSEPNNSKQAQKLFRPMAYLFSPFAMWLPEVPAYRGKKKTLGLKLAEKKRRCGYYPFKTLTHQQLLALQNRTPDKIPYAEDFLDCEPACPPKPWAYNPLTGTGWMKTLNEIEINLKKLFKN